MPTRKGPRVFQQTIENTVFTTKPCALNQRASLTTLPSRRQEAPASRLNEAGLSLLTGTLTHARRIGGSCSGRLTTPSELHHPPSRTPNRGPHKAPREAGPGLQS